MIYDMEYLVSRLIDLEERYYQLQESYYLLIDSYEKLKYNNSQTEETSEDSNEEEKLP